MWRIRRRIKQIRAWIIIIALLSVLLSLVTLAIAGFVAVSLKGEIFVANLGLITRNITVIMIIFCRQFFEQQQYVFIQCPPDSW